MISVRQMKAARALLAWSQSDLAAASGISEPTIGRLEAEDGPVGGARGFSAMGHGHAHGPILDTCLM